MRMTPDGTGMAPDGWHRTGDGTGSGTAHHEMAPGWHRDGTSPGDGTRWHRVAPAYPMYLLRVRITITKVVLPTPASVQCTPRPHVPGFTATLLARTPAHE